MIFLEAFITHETLQEQEVIMTALNVLPDLFALILARKITNYELCHQPYH